MGLKNDTKSALKITFIFLFTSLAYIYLSDHLIIWSDRVFTVEQATSIQTIKGSLYVIFFSVFLFFISRHYLIKVDLTQKKLEDYQEHLEESVAARTRELEKKTLKLKISQQSLRETVDELNDTAYQLREANLQLEKSNKELDAFSYTVSHDLRAPLRSINGFSKAIMEDCQSNMDATCRDYVQRIHDNSIKMENLINEILKLSRISSNSINVEQVNLTEIVRKVEFDLRQSEPERKVDLQIQEGLVTKGDKNLMRILMHNLLENAWKFTKYVPDARIEVGSMEGEGKEILFVKDNGVGFDMKNAEKLFQPFQRQQHENKFPGTGIGLATVNKIVSRHNGLVWAKGKKGQGATFYLQIP